MDWLLHGISLIFISLIDWMVYTLLSASYSVFLAVSKIYSFVFSLTSSASLKALETVETETPVSLASSLKFIQPPFQGAL